MDDNIFTGIYPAPHQPANNYWQDNRLGFTLFAKDALQIDYVFYRNSYSLSVGDRLSALKSVTLLQDQHCFGDIWSWEAKLSPQLDNDFLLGYLIRVWKQSKGGEESPFHWIIDPYTKESDGGEIWGQAIGFQINPQDLSIKKIKRTNKLSQNEVRRLPILRKEKKTERTITHPFRPLNKSIIYECHVRGMTQSPTAPLKHSKYAGTFLGLTECIPYFQDLGITTLELLPLFDFDENENRNISPFTKKTLVNYWGYSPLLFFAPKQNYAYDRENYVQEFKDMVAAFHQADLEIILDVVFNHTAELDETGPIDHFKWLDASTWYLHEKDGSLSNFSGCGNTLNCSHPQVKQLIIASLRYWVHEMGVDGFRFDLATILNRDVQGTFQNFPHVFWDITQDPMLQNIKLIVEPWDAGGGYQPGYLAKLVQVAEWNDFFRDTLRKSLKGEEGQISSIKQILLGTPERFGPPDQANRLSVNFTTSHDGFTLFDLVSYNSKHNNENGENNQDGSNDNFSNNCGWEGNTHDREINTLRFQKIRAFHAILFISTGIPMLLNGDEFARTQNGNNNAYCHDSAISWIDWDLLNTNEELRFFVRGLIDFRMKNWEFMFSKDSQYKWYNSEGKSEDLRPHIRTITWQISHPTTPEKVLLILINFFESSLTFSLPKHVKWSCLLDSYQGYLHIPFTVSNSIDVLPYSIRILTQYKDNG